jgi:hypothetical protein
MSVKAFAIGFLFVIAIIGAIGGSLAFEEVRLSKIAHMSQV